MRKQTARIGLSFAVIPISALALHGLVGDGPPKVHNSALVGARVTHALHHANRSNHDIANIRASTGSPDTTPVKQVATNLVEASSNVLAQGRVIEAQNARYAYALSQERAAASSRAVVYESSSTTTGPPSAPVAHSVSDSMAAVLGCIRQYESGNNYADTSNPYYRGAYQFAWSTWQSVGGTGDPAAASPAEQDMRAETLAERSGWGAWSTSSMCGV